MFLVRHGHKCSVGGLDPPSAAHCDFSKWKDHDSYQKAFDRLLEDLKATDPKTKTKDIAATRGQL